MKRKILTSVSLLLVAAIIMTTAVYAWLIKYRLSLTLIVGDAEISVSGFYEIAKIGDELKYPVDFDDVERLETIPLEEGEILAFKFDVVNESTDRDALLSLRLSDLSEEIFRYFEVYCENNGSMNSDQTTKFKQSASANTAKLAYLVEDVYYENEEGEIVELADKHGYLWKYSNGQKIFEDVPLPAVTIDEESGDRIKHPVSLYFMFTYTQSSIAIEAYKEWLFSYGHEHGARLLSDKTWDALEDAEKEFIDGYLQEFFDSEIESITTGEDGTGDVLSFSLNLKIRYFEFIGENTGNK